jgi:hypothetical protein
LAEVPLGRRFSFSRFVSGDDARRLIWIRGDNVQVVDLETRTLKPEARIGTSGRKATQLLGEIGTSFVSGVPANFAAATDAVFSTDSKRAWVLAPTGQIATLDLASGKVLEHRAGGAFIVETRHLFLALTNGSVRVFDRRTGEAIQEHKLDVPSGKQPFVTGSSDGTRVLIGGGKTVILLHGETGRTIFTANGFGHVGAALFIN